MKQLIDQALRLLRLANRDLQAFYVLKCASEIDLSTVCFHAQQAVEKSLKAVLVCHGKDPTRTHDLNKIAYSLADEGIELPLTIEELSKLNPYAVIFRYDDLEIEILTRDEAQKMVETIYSWSRKIIEKLN